VANDRRTTRILVVGDSFAFGNQSIKSLDNSDFIGYAANWLLDRTALLKGIGPRPVTEFRLLMTRTNNAKSAGCAGGAAGRGAAVRLPGLAGPEK